MYSLSAGNLILQTLASIFIFGSHTYTINWSSIDKRPLPKWYDESKFGIFMHWGVYSVPSFSSEWFWNSWKEGRKGETEFMKQNFRPGFTYPDFGPRFTTEFFDPDKFASIIKSSGARYLVLTSKHHEGYTMWPSNYSWNWNSLDVGPNRDLVGELAQAIRKVGDIHFGLYFSQFEWFNRLYLKDKANGFRTNEYVKMRSIPEMKEIVNLYQPEVLWSDGDWEAASDYWDAKQFLAWLYNESPVKTSVAVNDRWGNDSLCKHGGFYTCQDRYDPGKLLTHKWENCMTVDTSSWGFRRTMTYENVASIEYLIEKLARTISCGGNLLLNIGPTHDGRIVPIFEERLNQMGKFLQYNGEAVYETKPWIYQNDTITSNIWYTSRMRSNDNWPAERLYNVQSEEETIVYAFVLKWPGNNKLVLGSAKPTAQTKISMLGYTGDIKFIPHDNYIIIDLSDIVWTELPTFWAWVIKLEFLQTQAVVPEFHIAEPDVYFGKKPFSSDNMF